jgi:hypothetical protein
VSYRFLPWTRRGLAAEIREPDDVQADMSASARLPVRLTLAHGPQPSVDLQLYGPGDVTGVDLRAIVRTEPPRGTTNFAPDEFAAIEFDPPDLPWLFTPARADADDRLRPWLALVVVADQPGVAIEVSPGRSLPQLTIESPASPAAELPDLAESWAWAHAHLVEGDPGGDVAAKLAADPDLNTSRLLCPRRLEPDREYLACLVPTTEAGRLAGLGLDAPEAPTTGPAWDGGARAILPLYYHWRFRTGPAGDFESLARKLEPRPLPDTVGRRSLFVGAADPALPQLPADAGGILELEGALRAPQPGTGDAPLGPEQAPLVDALVQLLNAPDRHVSQGASDDAEAVAPPIYGQWPVRQHVVPETRPRWLRELNTDPRHRVAAGLGAQVVRANQERYVDAAWKQVGDVLAANQLLDRARLMRRVGERIHRRHVQSLGVDGLFAVSTPVHARVALSGGMLQRQLETSHLPPGAADPGFRRMSAPRGRFVRRGAALAGGASEEAVAVTALGALARGDLKLDLVARVPDGIVASALLAELPSSGNGAPVGLPGRVPADMVTELTTVQRTLETRPPGSLVLRANVALSGIVTERVLERARSTIGVSGSLHGTLGTLIEHSLAGRAAAAAPPLTRPAAAVTTTAAPPAAIASPVADPAVVARLVSAFDLHLATFEPSVVALRPPDAPLDLGALRGEVVEALDPTGVIERRAVARIRVATGALTEQAFGDRLRPSDDLGPVLAGPVLSDALYRDLAAYDQDRFLPGAGNVPSDTVSLLETNPRFVEAFLVGANHEMNRELLWRRYPTDRRGTPFRRFWDRLDGQADIGPIHEFGANARLGTNSFGQLEGSLVLLVRGELLRRYPNSVVYATPAGADKLLDPNAQILLPAFAGRLEPDLTFAGFELTVEAVTPEPGWFFVIQEQPTEPRFGLDVPVGTGGAAPTTWAGLDWSHVGVDPGGYLRLAATTLMGESRPLAPRVGPAASVGSARFGQNAAHMAAITFQRPFRAAIHSSKVLA